METAANAENRTLISQAEYARRRGCKPQHVSKLISQGKIKTYGGKKVDPDEADAMLDALADPSRDGVRRANAERYGKPFVAAPKASVAASESRHEVHLTDEQKAALGRLGDNKADPDEIPEFAKSKAEREHLGVLRERMELAKDSGKLVERDLAKQLATDVGRKWLGELTHVEMELPSTIVSIVARLLPDTHPDQLFTLEQEVRQAVSKSKRDAVNSVRSMLEDLAKPPEATTN